MLQSQVIAIVATLMMTGTCVAAEANLYRSVTFVTGQMKETRGPGLAKCLEDVLVKVSGDARLIGDPAVVALSNHAADFVADFSYHDRMSGIPVHDEQGTRDRPYDLTVNFQPDKIDVALRSLGREPWITPRPRVVAFVRVQTGETSYALSGDGDRGQGQREALLTTANRYAIPLVLPSETILSGSNLNFEALATAVPAKLGNATKAAGGDVALTGSLVWSDEALGWGADWHMVSAGKAYRWGISGVNFDDAFRNAIRGAAQILSGHGQPN